MCRVWCHCCICFCQHLEQMLFPFIHHQMCGESLWVVIPYPERDKLYQLVREMATAHASWSARQGKKKGSGKAKTAPTPTAAADVATLSRILLFSKNLFPPLSLLDKHGIQYYRIPLKAGQVLIAHGGFAHFGFSTAKGETHSFATNVATEAWLTTGGPEFIIHFFEWVAGLDRMDEVDTGRNRGRSKLHPLLKEHGISAAQLTCALNACPPSYTCSLLHGIKADLLQHVRDPSRTVCQYALTSQQAQAVIAKLDSALVLLHAARSFLRRHYADDVERLVCTCGREGESSADAEMNADSEWQSSNPSPSCSPSTRSTRGRKAYADQSSVTTTAAAATATDVDDDCEDEPVPAPATTAAAVAAQQAAAPDQLAEQSVAEQENPQQDALMEQEEEPQQRQLSHCTSMHRSVAGEEAPLPLTAEQRRDGERFAGLRVAFQHSYIEPPHGETTQQQRTKKQDLQTGAARDADAKGELDLPTVRDETRSQQTNGSCML